MANRNGDIDPLTAGTGAGTRGPHDVLPIYDQVSQKAGYVVPAIVTEAMKRYDEAKHHHWYFVRAYERRERAYRGILKATQQAARWRHTLHPPYAFNMIETIIASTLEMGLTTHVRPAPMTGMTMQQAQQLLLQTQVVEDLVAHERMYDHFDRKQRPLLLCDAIGGRGIFKTYWNWSERAIKRQGVTDVIVHGTDGEVLGTVPTITEIEQKELLYDNSTTEVVDPRDFIFHEAAAAMQPNEPRGAQFVFHRSWYSMEQLKTLEADGFLKNVDYLSATRDFADEYLDRERSIWHQNRSRGLVEVIEYWCYARGAVWRTIIGNRQVLLRDQEMNPFWHGQYPFGIVSSQPSPFSTTGMSDMELIEQLQEMIWELTNQRLDNLELINNAIMLIRADVDDPDAFQYYPGAQWPVEDPKQVVPLVPPYQLASVSLEAESLLKDDMQSVSASGTMAGGGSGKNAQQSATATGASIIMAAANSRIAVKKWHAQQGFTDEAWMRLKLCQQFIGDTRLLHSVGPSGKMSFQQIGPLDIQGEFLFYLEDVGSATDKATRKAEAQGLLQLMMQAFPMSYVSGTPIDLHEVMLWVLRQWGMEDQAEAFFEPQQTPDPNMVNMLMGNAPKTNVRLQGFLGPGEESAAETAQGQLVMPASESKPAPPGDQPNMGTTSSTAVDASKPSTSGGLSLSGQQFLQRAQALNGGAKGRV